ncbi:TPA_asm: hypothetical protein vir555_00054 [Caudoviricetes sp. vir555]|nr:TPA_asm: hypothetical protein vir555_00054 [Caudoviricetes sp. vir555]
MPLNKFDTSVLNNPDDVSVKPEGVFNTSVLGTPDYEDMTPEFQAYAELQHEADLNKRSYFERVIDLGGHLISGAKRAPGDVIRGMAMNVKDFYKPENPDDLFYETQFSIMTPTERARVAQRANRNIELGMDPKTAKEDALNESLQEKHEHANMTADAMMKVADSKKFQPLPGYEHPETFMQGVAGALGQQIVRLPLMLFPATRPMVAPVMQMEIAGYTYQHLIEEGVEPDRAKVAANMSAMAQTPLEFLGDLVAVKAILGPRAWKNYVSGIARTMGTEGAEEFAQQYPDAMATLWAMNPDVTLKDMWEEVSSRETFREALYAGAIGAVTGGIVAGGGIGVREGWNKYVTKKQQTINDQRTGVLLGALTKMRLGEKLTDEENTALDQAMTSLPMDAVNRLRFQSPIESDGRTTVFEGMRQILPDPVQHEKVMAILDSIAHSYAEITGKDPEAFYEDELIGAEKTTLEEFQKGVELDMAAQGRTQFQAAAYHGSPHTFDKFSTEKIGTGEGAQAYGYGLYFAGKREIAEYYKTSLTRRQSRDLLVPKDEAVSIITRRKNDIHNEQGYEDIETEDGIRHWISMFGDDYSQAFENMIKSGAADEKLFEGILGPKKQGHLYEVELAPEEDEYLLWDKPLSEQSEKVRAALAEAMGPGILGKESGQILYLHLSGNMSLGSDKAASEYLHSLGIRGIKYLDGTSRGKGEGAYNYVIFSDEDVEIKARFQLAAKTPLGATTWTSQGEAIIHAFESANISTPIHEIGHVLLGLIEKYDPISYKAVSGWLKIPEERAAKGLNAWTDTEHEKFAKGFEVYVMEGRAPTFRLQPVFRALKAMLLEVYRRIRKLDVQLNDDVRKVFDHWLSTEDERTEDMIRDISNWFDVDQIPHPMGELSPDDYESYDDIASKAREIVAAKVGDKRKRIMAQVRRQLYRMAKTQVEEMEYYQDLSYLMRCKGFNEQAVRESRNWSKDEMEYFKKMGVVRKNGHREPDEFVHEQVYSYGRSSYDTGDGFLDMVLVMPPKKEAIQDLYNRFLREYEESIEQEERNVNDMDAILEAEINILNTLMGRSPKRTKIALDRLGNVEALTDDDLRRLKKEYKDLDAVAREAYREGVRQTREELEQVLKDTKAAGKEEVKAAKGKAKEQAQALKEHQKERIAAIRARNMEKILSIKEQQRERIAKLKEHAKIQKEKQKIFRRMKRYLKSKDMLYEYRYQLQRFLAGYVKVKGFKEDPEQPALDTFLRNAVPIEIRDDDFISGLLDQVPSPWRGPDGNVLVPGRRSLDDLRSVALIADLIKGMDTLERENRKEEAIRFREQLAEGIYKAHGKEPSQYNVTGPLVADRPSWFDGAKDNIHQFSAELTKIEFLCNFLDGHELLGPMFNAVFKKVADAENAELVMSRDYFNNAAKILKGVIKDDAWFKRKYDIPGIPKQLTREQMFMIALNSGNQGNRKDLVEGNKIPDEAIDHIWDNMLTEQERNAVEKIWSLIDTLFPMLDNVNRKLMGMPLKKVEGHYFPIKHERKLSLFAARNEDVQNAKDAFVGPAYMAYPRAGHRDKRTGAVLPLRLDIGVIASHLEETIHDITHSIPVTEAYRVIIDPKVAKAITDIAGEQMYEQLVPWLKNISRPMREARSVVESLSLRMRKGTTAAFLGLKATTTALQMLAGTQTIDEIGYAPVMKAVTKFAGNPVEMVKAINEKSVMMRYRGRMFDREIAQFHRTMAAKKVTRVMEKVSACYFTPIIVLDMAVAYPSWLAAYEKGFKDFQGDENKAVDYADSVVRRTQSAAGPKDLASIQRGNELKKWVTMFYTFFSVFQNRMMELNRKADMQGMLKPETLYMYFRSYMLQIAIPAVLSFILYERRLPEGKEWFTELLYYRLTGIPIIRDIANPVLNGWDYEFSPAAGGYAAFAKTFKDFGKTIEAWIEEDEIPWSRLGRDIVWTAGYWYGLPSAQTLITMDGIVDLWEDELESPLNLLFRQPRDMED